MENIFFNDNINRNDYYKRKFLYVRHVLRKNDNDNRLSTLSVIPNAVHTVVKYLDKYLVARLSLHLISG